MDEKGKTPADFGMLERDITAKVKTENSRPYNEAEIASRYPDIKENVFFGRLLDKLKSWEGRPLSHPIFPVLQLVSYLDVNPKQVMEFMGKLPGVNFETRGYVITNYTQAIKFVENYLGRPADEKASELREEKLKKLLNIFIQNPEKSFSKGELMETGFHSKEVEDLTPILLDRNKITASTQKAPNGRSAAYYKLKPRKNPKGR